MRYEYPVGSLVTALFCAPKDSKKKGTAFRFPGRSMELIMSEFVLLFPGSAMKHMALDCFIHAIQGNKSVALRL